MPRNMLQSENIKLNEFGRYSSYYSHSISCQNVVDKTIVNNHVILGRSLGCWFLKYNHEMTYLNELCNVWLQVGNLLSLPQPILLITKLLHISPVLMMCVPVCIVIKTACNTCILLILLFRKECVGRLQNGQCRHVVQKDKHLAGTYFLKKTCG